MTRYAIDRARNALTAQWSTGIGDTAITVTELPSSSLRHHTMRLAACLTELSTICWRCYTHPAAATDQQGPGSLGWHRRQERDAFTTILPTLTTKSISSSPATKVEEAARSVGRVLRDLDGTQLTTRVITDVAAELAAVEQAERGDLSGRAEQAAALSREDASPLQVSQADTLLQRHPFGSEALRTQIDPTAAAIAAAHWLYAAVAITARRTGMHPVQVIAATDQQAKPLATESLSDVIALIGAGGRPRDVAMLLVRNALHVAEGHLRGITEARHRITAAEQLIEKAQADHPELDLDSDSIHLPLTSLNPTRPAPDLLENLLHGIDSCWRLYERHAAIESDEPQEKLLDLFLTSVRREAAARNKHLL
ncbi:hypothetical protein SAMN05444920_11171 [Nonomuraea solani]|uniref:Uncharacterized protein n=1 Tax=Nonomuraea solani TaxID=1144553 RepID=A0A1H6EIZ2_9ACTN|nr:hypothetical protein [Nonomuraea solani]SEG97817.1 hypothetical protein SAMN05444920_11171 [Nonomuraea solani]